MTRLLPIGLSLCLLGAFACAPPPPRVPSLDSDALAAATRCGTPPRPGGDSRPTLGAVPVRIRYVHRMGGSFRRQHARFALSGTPLCQREGPAPRPTVPEPVLETTLLPGRYRLAVDLRLRGHGLGVFSYLKGYRFRVRSAHTFTVHENTPLCLDVLAGEQGDARTPLKERPRIRYRVTAPCPASAP